MAIMHLVGDFNERTEIFFIIWKETQPGMFKPVYKSEAQPRRKNVQDWHTAVIDTNHLCYGNHSVPFRIDFMAASNTGDHKCLGSKTLSVDEL